MQISTARNKARAYVGKHILMSQARRPPKDEAVMVRYPDRSGTLILAPDPDVLVEKVAKRIQAKARREAN